MKKSLLALCLFPCLSVAQENSAPEAIQPFLMLADKPLDVPFAAGQLLKQVKVDGQQLQFLIQDDSFGYLNDAQLSRISEYMQVSVKYVFCKAPGMADAVSQGWSAQYVYKNMNDKTLLGPLTVDTCESLPSDAGVLAEQMVNMLNDMEPVQMGPLIIHGGTLAGKEINADVTLSMPIELMDEQQIAVVEQFIQSFGPMNDHANCENSGTRHMIQEGYSINTMIKSYEGEPLQTFTTNRCPAS
jgi:hypothetical protein